MKVKMYVLLLFSVNWITVNICQAQEDVSTDLKQAILNVQVDKVISAFETIEKDDLAELEKVVVKYSEKIGRGTYREEIYQSYMKFGNKDREGYMFIDTNNNIVASLLYKLRTNGEGNKKIQFLEFRSSTADLPCISFPGKSEVKCINMPIKPPARQDSLRSIYPKKFKTYKLYHLSVLSNKYLESQGDMLKKAIVFNRGNLKIDRSFTRIINGLETKIDLNTYTLAELHNHGEPSTKIVYDPKFFSKEEVQFIKEVVERELQEEVSLIIYSSRPGTAPILRIGGIFKN